MPLPNRFRHNWQFESVDADSAEGGWWGDDGDVDRRGVDASVARVEAALAEHEAIGLVGFEQGGALAAVVAARATLREGPPIEFAVVCGSAMPPQCSDLFERLRAAVAASSSSSPDQDGGAAPIVPTLHYLSATDAVNPPSEGEALAACFGPTAEVLWHDRGSAMPGKEWWSQSDAFLERAWAGDKWGGEVYSSWDPRSARKE